MGLPLLLAMTKAHSEIAVAHEEPLYLYYASVIESLKQENSKLLGYFNMVVSEYKSIVDQEIKIEEAKLEGMKTNLQNSRPIFNAICDELKEQGITIEVQLSESMLFLEFKINNLIVINPFSDIFGQLNNISKNIAVKEAENETTMRGLMSSLKKASWKAKWAIFNRNRKHQKKSAIEADIESVKDNFSKLRLDDQKLLIEKLTSLDIAKKDLLRRGIEEVASTFQKVEDIVHISDKKKQCSDFMYSFDARIREAIDRLILNNSTFSIGAIFSLLNGVEIIQENQVMAYNMLAQASTLLRNVVIWFINNVYVKNEDVARKGYKEYQKMGKEG